MERKMIPILEDYNKDDEYLYKNPYLFIKGFALRNFPLTLKALPVARLAHDGQYRQRETIVNGKKIKLPYVLHVLKVCTTLIGLNLPMTNEELDTMYAAALLHDAIEDAGDKMFPEGGKELIYKYHLTQEVLDIVLLLSKYSGASEIELNEYFNKIKKNKIAAFIKLSDRSHNVEDLYSKKLEKLHEASEIMFSKEYKTWANAQDKKIAKKLGLTLPKEKKGK